MQLAGFINTNMKVQLSAIPRFRVFISRANSTFTRRGEKVHDGPIGTRTFHPNRDLGKLLLAGSGPGMR